MATTAALIFAATYVLISLPRIPFVKFGRPAAALLGAALMVACGVMSLSEAGRAVNLDTLELLLGMMVLIAYLKEARFFEAVSAWIVLHSGTPRRLLVLLAVASGALSALFVNDTICLLFTPIVLRATQRTKLGPVPYLLALVTGANVGSAVTLIGNPQNMLVGISSGISFGRFALVMVPVGAACLAVVAGALLVLYRRELPENFAEPPDGMPATDAPVVRRVGVIVVLMLLAWFAPTERLIPAMEDGRKLPLVALAGGAAAILAAGRSPVRALASVDWPLLAFFAGLFVVVGGVGRVGILEDMHRAVAPAFGTGVTQQSSVLAVFTVVGSNVVSNVPFVLVARDWIGSFADQRLAWYVLAAASTFAGNLTIVGSVANIIVLEQAKDTVRIGFFQYLRAGLPVTLLTTALGVAMLLAMRAAGLPI